MKPEPYPRYRGVGFCSERFTGGSSAYENPDMHPQRKPNRNPRTGTACAGINSGSVNRSLTGVDNTMYQIKRFEKEDVWKVMAFESELREQEPDTYYWEPDEAYAKRLEMSFDDPRFNTALSFIAVKDNKVIGRIDASFLATRSDASCRSAYLDWICVLKSERHNKVAQALLKALRAECRERGAETLIALMANNEEARRFYQNVENASIHDTGIWMEI